MADTDLAEITKEIERRSGAIREIDTTLAQIPNAQRFGNFGPGGLKRRFTNDGVGPRTAARQDDFGYQRRHSDVKRGRFEDVEDYDSGDDDIDDRPKRTLLSTVSLPAIETKSREEKLKELESKTNKDVKQRNKRMFGNLLMGTLQRFKKEEQDKKKLEQKQADIQRAVDAKLEEEKMAEKKKAQMERAELLEKRRNEEREIRALTRQKALIQYAEQKVKHYRQLQNFIGTQTKPKLFYLPAKHTLRSLELQKQSAEMIDTLIKLREDQLQSDLRTNPESRREEELEKRRKIAQPKDEQSPVERNISRRSDRSFSRSNSVESVGNDEDDDISEAGGDNAEAIDNAININLEE